jgi:hypothetical protein
MVPTPANDLPARATTAIDEFSGLISGIPYERKGILFSEMFFLWLCVRDLQPRRILESGRARGQSTLILSHCFPRSEIVSVEYDRNSPDVAIAAERLAGRSNVSLLFGDATRLLPEMQRDGDIVLIDGPKGFRGLRLAMSLLRSGRSPAVFLHDAGRGSTERKFLARRLPEAYYSDTKEFATIARRLDGGAWDELPTANRWSDAGYPEAGYGFGLACIPWSASRSYGRALFHAMIDGFIHRTFNR